MTTEIESTLSTFKIFIASNPASLRTISPDATVEAEYGDEVVEGTKVTLAHHGPRSGNPPPCVAEVEALPEGSSVGLSHIDLDSLGGLLRLAGYTPRNAREAAFWGVAACVDLKGPHRLEGSLDEQGIQGTVRDWIRGRLHAYWAWSQVNRVLPPRDGSTEDVAAKVLEHATALLSIFNGDEELLAAGEEFAAKEAALNEQSLLRYHHADSGLAVVVRRASAFTNHLYTTPWGETASVVVSLRDDYKSVTISCEGSDVPLDCKLLVQSLWGPEAGGHTGIAGSPRGKEMDRDDLNQLVTAVIDTLGGSVRYCTCGSDVAWAMCGENSPYCG